MKRILTFMFIILSNLCIAQNIIKINTISKNDSLKLSNCFKSFIRAIEIKNLKTIKALCLNKVDCEMCIPNDSFERPVENAFVSIETLAEYLSGSLQNLKLYKAITSEPLYMTSTSYLPADGNYPKELKIPKGTFFTEYELSYLIQKSENKYHFTFTKIVGTFKIWKVSTSP